MAIRRLMIKKLSEIRHEFISVDKYEQTIFKNDLDIPHVSYVSDVSDVYTLLDVLSVDYGKVLCKNTESGGLITLKVDDLSSDELCYIIFLMVVK